MYSFFVSLIKKGVRIIIVMIYQNKEYDIADNKHDLMEKLHMLFRADIYIHRIKNIN